MNGVAGRFTPDVRERCYARLRREPGEHGYGQQVVPGSLPVLFFGDAGTARVATVGLNPSHGEYVGAGGVELDGSLRRLETLRSLRADSRAALTAGQCDAAIARMRRYFLPGRPVYRWFRPLDRVTSGMGAGFAAGGAVHLDLVQETTTQKWADVAREYPSTLHKLRALDLPFLRWQLETFPVELVMCDGATASEAVRGLFDEHEVIGAAMTGVLPGRKVWLESVRCSGRMLWLCGWNIPLNASGVSYEDLSGVGQKLGALLNG